MVIHKCDVCGKEMCNWLTLSITTHVEEWNGKDASAIYGTREVCQDCFNKYFEKVFRGEGEN